MAKWEIIGKIREIETIAAGSSIRDRWRLSRIYGKGRWRKLKGLASVRLPDGAVLEAEVHWYEAHGVGNLNKHSTDSIVDNIAELDERELDRLQAQTDVNHSMTLRQGMSNLSDRELDVFGALMGKVMGDVDPNTPVLERVNREILELEAGE